MALAEGTLDEAESWLNRALTEAQNSRNQLQTANIHAKLGLVARERGDFDLALKYLTQAYHALTNEGATHLQTQIDLWLTELYIKRGEESRAEETLSRAEQRLRGTSKTVLPPYDQQDPSSNGFVPLGEKALELDTDLHKSVFVSLLPFCYFLRYNRTVS